MGIDKDEAVSESSSLTDGGQSDAIFLVIINPHDKSIKIYAIDRNTMTDITMKGMGDDGSDITTTAQIAVQHGFGDGRQGSCELTVNAVSSLMYNLPIHGYIAINYGALASINDAVGGVEVTVPEDMAALSKQWNVNWKAGDIVNLKGEEAMTYIRARDPDVFESARSRTLRQKTWVIDEAVKRGKNRIYFLSRDGYQMYIAAKKIIAYRKIDIKCKYLHVSRYSMKIPTYHMNIDKSIDSICTGGMQVRLLFTELAMMEQL